MAKTETHKGDASAAPAKSFGSKTEYAPEKLSPKVANLNPSGGKGKSGPVGR
jgi:hypothetical protein